MLICTPFKKPFVLSCACALLILAVDSSQAGLIGVLNTGSQVAPGSNLQTLSFDAGAIADKLIVEVSSESSATAGQVSITYNGVGLTPVIDGTGRFAGIWYLDNPYTGGAANLTVDMTAVGVTNGIGFGVVSIAGSAAGFEASAADTSGNVSINTTTAGSLVVAGHVSNTASGGATADSPLTQLYGAQIGSSRGAAGYQNGVSAGLNNYSFSGVAPNPVTVAASFAPADDGRVAITDLYNTGVDGSGALLGNDLDDPHYQITDLNNAGPLADSTIASPPGAWVSNDADSRWIGVDNASTGGNAAPGSYTYETTFTIANDADLSTALISGRWATDNGGLDILLNGVSIGDGLPSNFGALTNFIIDGSSFPFLHGTNTLTFQLNNAGTTDNPTGLRVDDLVGWYQVTVPEPTSVATWTIFGLGLAGFGYYRKRRTDRC